MVDGENQVPSVTFGPRPPYPGGRRVDALVLARAAQQPEAVALRWRGRRISYGELVDRAERIATGLADSGTGPGQIVAVRLPRGPELVATLLGILRAGAAYTAVPLDWPAARALDVVRACRAGTVITSDLFPGDDETPSPATSRGDADPVSTTLVAAGIRLLDVGALSASRRRPPAAGDPQAGSEPCCVFLTSGSTGVPKAALAPHAGVVRMAHDPAHAFDASSVTMQTAPPSWDVFALELWPPLIHGGSVLIHPGSRPTSTDVRAAVAAGVNTLCPPVVLFTLYVEDDVDCLSGLRTVVTGGERAGDGVFARCRRHHPELRLVHAYGPVETTGGATAHVLSGDPGDWPPVLPIGRPVAHTEGYVLGADRRPVPAGVVGELALGGDGVALGYLTDDSDQLRHEQFPELPLGPGGALRRVYLTGDRVVMDRAGVLTFVGRGDRQLKVRGVRVEPGETERAVESLPGVVRAVVVPDRSALAVFYTGVEHPAADVRGVVRDALPPAFVPGVVQHLSELPLTATGKADAAALTALLPRASTAGTGPGSPGSPGSADGLLGLVLAEAAAVLDEVVAAEADLFERGATSLTAIRLANRLAGRSGRRVSAADVFRARTARRLADLLETREALPRRAATAPARTRPGMVGQQNAHWLKDRIAPGCHDLISPVLLRLHGELDPTAVHAAIRTTVARHEALRTFFPVQGGRPAKQTVPEADLPALLDVAEPVAGLPAGLAAAGDLLFRRFDLTRDIPVRARLIPIGNRDQLLAVAFHHVAFDAWSERVFLQDLGHAYRVVRGGGSRRQPVTSYEATVLHQEDADDPERGERALGFWAGRLAGVEPFLAAGGAVSGPVAEARLPLPAATLDAAEESGRRMGGSSTVVLLAAYATALLETLDAPAIALSMPTAGRLFPEADDVIGCFSSDLLLTFRRGDPLEVAREAALQVTTALEYGPVSQQALMRRLGPAAVRWLSFGGARFSVQDDAAHLLGLPGVRAERLRVAEGSSSIALALEVWPGMGEAVLRHRSDRIAAGVAHAVAERWTAGLERLTGVLA
jgi:amino acid adenylation domain-containing protein